MAKNPFDRFKPDQAEKKLYSTDPALGHLAQNALCFRVLALVSERDCQNAHALKRILVLISELIPVRRDYSVPNARRSRVPSASPKRSGKEQLRASVFWLHVSPCTSKGSRHRAGELLFARLALEPRFVASMFTLRDGPSDEARRMREFPATRASSVNRLGTRIEADSADSALCHFQNLIVWVAGTFSSTQGTALFFFTKE
jgi:hypothetical protein